MCTSLKTNLNRRYWKFYGSRITIFSLAVKSSGIIAILSMDELEEALFALNPEVPSRAIEEAMRKLLALDAVDIGAEE